MTWPQPSARSLLVLHLGRALPLVALAIWFGLIDRMPFGEGRCSSCGMEGYVIAAHVVAAGWLAVLVACAAAARRRLQEGVGAPGRVTLTALAAVGLFVAASLVWHDLFSPPAFAAMLASLVLFPAAAIWWLVGPVAWWRRPPHTDRELRRRLGAQLTAAWMALTLLLPAMFGWVWADRVDWLVF
jgi:glucan phosphoethanolaminetransferase (alkaline phosphatase superfamily)